MIDMITRHTGMFITPDGRDHGRNHDFVLPPGATQNEMRDHARSLEVPGDRLTGDQIARASWLATGRAGTPVA